MLTQDEHVASDFCHDLALVLGPAVLQDVLDNIIPVLILGRDSSRAQKGAQMDQKHSQQSDSQSAFRVKRLILIFIVRISSIFFISVKMCILGWCQGVK